jgi:hypothetical protein
MHTLKSVDGRETYSTAIFALHGLASEAALQGSDRSAALQGSYRPQRPVKVALSFEADTG